jgi:hypothetical protein
MMNYSRDFQAWAAEEKTLPQDGREVVELLSGDPVMRQQVGACAART